ncbi:MAG: peptidase M28 family protein [Blastocatellia bacterium AA13]|nr:MAG: peptidase M28 family protein [Blastocatellia bacterium AA13]
MKNRILPLLSSVALLLSFTNNIVGQRRPTPITDHYDTHLEADLKTLQEAALADDYALRTLAHLCNNIGPRLSGSPQAAHAVEYVAAEMRKLGLEVKLEKCTVPHWVRGIETAALTAFSGQAPNTTQKVVVTALGGSVATPPEGVSAEIVVVNSFEQLKTMGRVGIEGKIVLFNVRFDTRMAAQGEWSQAYGQAVAYRGLGPSEAARLGAVAALVRSVGGADFRLPHTGALRYAPDAPRIPAGAVTSEDADTIAYLSAEGKVTMHLTLTPQTLADIESFNVVADLKGTEHPEEIVIVSGHLDSWDLGTGAIDDGAGVVIAMETAQLIRQLGLKPKRTIRIITWMNEESSGSGSRAYAESHKSEFPNHIAAIESDLGAGHPLGFNARIGEKALAMLAPLTEILRASGAGLIKVVPGGTGADIEPLEVDGVPCFGMLQDGRTYFNYHHTAADTFDKVIPRELAENAAAMALLAYAVASLPDRLPR